MRQLIYSMFISKHCPLVHLGWKENLVKHQKVSKYYENDWRSLLSLSSDVFPSLNNAYVLRLLWFLVVWVLCMFLSPHSFSIFIYKYIKPCNSIVYVIYILWSVSAKLWNVKYIYLRKANSFVVCCLVFPYFTCFIWSYRTQLFV